MKSLIRMTLALALLAFCASFASADDCGNQKDNGKGTPACHNGGGNNGGNGGAGGSTGPVVVTNDNVNTIHVGSKSNSSATSNSNSSSTSNSAATATGGNASSVATGGSANASQTQTANGGNASNGGQSNVQATNFNQVHQTPLALAPESTSTAPCRVAGSGAGSSPFFGVSFSGSKVDTECEKRATAIAFAQLGQTQAAIEMLCATKAAKSGDVEVCKALAAFKKNGAVVKAQVQ